MCPEQGASSFGSGQKLHLAQPYNFYSTADIRDNYLPVSEGCDITQRAVVSWDSWVNCSKEIQTTLSGTSFYGQVHLHCKRPQRLPHHMRGLSLTKDLSYGGTYCRA